MTLPTFEGTSASGTLVGQLARPAMIVGTLSVSSGPASDPSKPLSEQYSRVITSIVQTNAGVPIQPSEEPAESSRRTAESIAELRRVSGLTWEQLAGLFGTSRRALHFWASGKPMADKNEAHLVAVLEVVRQADRGSARVNRRLLAHASADGTTALVLLAEHEYKRAKALLGTGSGRPAKKRVTSGRLSARAPVAPADLVGALQDRVHEEPGRVHAAKRVRVRGDS